jgi:hypothetical protein
MVLVTGGFDPSWMKTVWASAEIFDPATGTWRWTGEMTHDRGTHLQILLKDGRVLVAGGWESIRYPKGKELATSETYDPATESWTQQGDLSAPLSNAIAVLLDDGRVFAAHGDNAEIFEPASGTWTPASAPPESVAGAGRLLPDGRVLVLRYDGGTLLYDPRSNAWERAAAAPGQGGWTWFFSSESGEAIAAIDMQLISFDPGAKTWRSIANLAAPISAHEFPTSGGLLGLSPSADLFQADLVKSDGSSTTVLGPTDMTGVCRDYGIELKDGRFLLPGAVRSGAFSLR